MRSRLVAAIANAAVLLLVGTETVTAQSALRPPPHCDAVVSNRTSEPNEYFEVGFQGIISLVKPFPDSNYRKAIVVSSRFTSMPHDPKLIVRGTVDRDSLKEATGKNPDCTANNDRCSVPIKGLAFRIRGYDGTVRCPIDTKDGFVELLDSLPRISRLKGVFVTIKNSIYDDTVNSPEMAVFEIEGGDGLEAYPFLNTSGAFFRADGSGQVEYYDNSGKASKKCLQFADLVIWRGRTIGRAVLEVSKSGDIGGNEWKEVKFRSGNDEPLWVGLQNLSHQPMRDSTHFKLFHKMLDGDDLPVVCSCVNDVALDCTATTMMGHRKRSLTLEAQPLNAVPGCSDTGWP